VRTLIRTSTLAAPNLTTIPAGGPLRGGAGDLIVGRNLNPGLDPRLNIDPEPQVGRHVEELEDVRLVVLDGALVLQFVGMMRRFDAAGEPIPLRLEGRQWLARLERVRPQVRGA